MTQISEPRQTISPEKALPPVEPPSAGFIVQLFVVPAIIVGIIVMIWLAFNWLAHMGDNPENYVRALARNNGARWQAAVNLANALRRPGSKFKSDRNLAMQLSAALESELASPEKTDEADARVRVYLCRALGEFDVADGLPALLHAAGGQESEFEIPVRASAVEAIALLAAGPEAAAIRANAQVASTLLACSQADDAALRSRAAFALGVLGGQPALDRLQRMLHDPIPDVRYNAATGLARHGDARAVDVLAEMLDPARLQLTESKADKLAQAYKRPIIYQNALRAVEKLAKADATSDLGLLQSAAARLSQAPIDPDIRAYARQVADELARRPTTPGDHSRQSSVTSAQG
jgi:HEAT repeat protein